MVQKIMLTRAISTTNFSAYFDKNYALCKIGCSIDAENIEEIMPKLQEFANTYRGQPYDICSDSIKVEFEKLEKEVKRAMSNKTKEN